MSTSPVRVIRRLVHALVAFAVLMAVIGGVPVVLSVVGALPHSVPTAQQLTHSLTTPDTSGLYFRVGATLFAWAAWAVFTAVTVREAAAAIRLRGPRPALPRHGLHRVGPAALVAAIAVLFVAGPIAVSFTTPYASATPDRTVTVDTVTPGQATTRANAPGVAALPTYRVQRYDTLWSIAATHLPGDPALRYQDIVSLNPDGVGADDEITTGALLTLPADAHGLAASASNQVTVQPGDTLSGISADHGIGDWHGLWAVNEGRAEPGGERLSDPNLIKPGWTVTVPTTTASTTTARSTTWPPKTVPTRTVPSDPSAPRATSHSGPSAPAPPPHRPNSPEGHRPTTASTPPVTPPAPSAAAPTTAHPAGAVQVPDQHQSGSTSWEEIFAGAGALLAAGLFTAWANRRHRQMRARRPGRAIRPTRAELIPVDKALRTHGPEATADVQFLDHALRSLSAAMADDPDATMPDVVAARMIGDRLDLHLARPHPSGPPTPWITDDSATRWSVHVTDELSVNETNADQYLAPYPTLVAIGYQPDGSRWLLDLESAGTIALTGDPERCADLGRFIAAELAVNDWSDQLRLTVVGFAPELTGLNPARVRHVTDLAAAASALSRERATALEARTAVELDVPTARMRGVAGDSWMPHVLLVAADTAADPAHADQLDQLIAAVRDQPERSIVAVVLAGDQPAAAAANWQASIGADGRMQLPALGLDLTAQGLPAEQVTAMGQLITEAANTRDVPMPPATGSKPYEQFCDAAGALRPDFTLPRITHHPAPTPSGATSILVHPGTSGSPRESVDAASVLSQPDTRYLRDGATSEQELQAIAPRLDGPRRASVAAVDPDLDADLADWRDPNSLTPKLTLLGPVGLQAHGDIPTERLPYFTEVVVYIATRDHGATVEQVADALAVSASAIYSRINKVRNWLGVDPVTGASYLPDSTKTRTGKARGVRLYEFTGLAVDADLFRRLRVRAHALGGTDGIASLQDALSLVTGRPFDQLRPRGYRWLAETPLDHYLSAGVVDVAHAVHLHHLQAGDLPRARAAAELGLQAAPFEEVPRMDLVAVMKAEGHGEQAERYLDEQIAERCEDRDAPQDLPERTEAIARARGWLSRTEPA